MKIEWSDDGRRRVDQVVEAVEREDHYLEWTFVRIVYEGKVFEFKVSTGPLRIGGYFGSIVNLSADGAERVNRILEAAPMTARLWDRIHMLFGLQNVVPIVQPSRMDDRLRAGLSPRMDDAAAMMTHSDALSSVHQALAETGHPGFLPNGGKQWVVPTRRVRDRSCNYGWYGGPLARSFPVTPGADRVIQSAGHAHDKHHVDYSQTMYVLDGKLSVDGRETTWRDVAETKDLRSFVLSTDVEGHFSLLPWPSVTVPVPDQNDRPTLRQGARGYYVKILQDRLVSLGYNLGSAGADSDFGPATSRAVMAFQRSQEGLMVDGVVGESTWSALDAAPDVEIIDVNEVLKAPTGAERQAIFGPLRFVSAPTKGNPEAIRITNDFSRKIVVAEVPQIRTVNPLTKGRVFCHRLMAEPLKALWAAWEAEGLLPLVKTWDGLYNPRFIRGSRRILSNHAFGTAFDINARWNWLGQEPASEGEEGSVRELVPIAEEHGFAWGGYFTRRDGMHFEFVGPKK